MEIFLDSLESVHDHKERIRKVKEFFCGLIGKNEWHEVGV